MASAAQATQEAKHQDVILESSGTCQAVPEARVCETPLSVSVHANARTWDTGAGL